MQVRYNFLSSHLRLDAAWCQNFKQLAALAIPNLSKTFSNNKTQLSLWRYFHLQERRQMDLKGREFNSPRALLEDPKHLLGITLTTRKTRSYHPCLVPPGAWDDWQALAINHPMPWRKVSCTAVSQLLHSMGICATSPKKTDARLLISFYKRKGTAWQIFSSVSQLQPKPAATCSSDDPRLSWISTSFKMYRKQFLTRTPKCNWNCWKCLRMGRILHSAGEKEHSKSSHVSSKMKHLFVTAQNNTNNPTEVCSYQCSNTLLDYISLLTSVTSMKVTLGEHTKEEPMHHPSIQIQHFFETLSILDEPKYTEKLQVNFVRIFKM